MTATATPANSKSSTLSPAKLGLIACTALVVGNVIGSGVYLLPASLAPFGGLALVGWLLSCAGALLVALVFAKLAQLIPRTGGPYAVVIGAKSLTDIYNSIILLATFVTLVPYAFCAMAELMIFSLRRADLKGQNLRWASVLAVLAFIFAIITIIGSGAQTVLYGFVLLLAGIPLYVWLKRA